MASAAAPEADSSTTSKSAVGWTRGEVQQVFAACRFPVRFFKFVGDLGCEVVLERHLRSARLRVDPREVDEPSGSGRSRARASRAYTSVMSATAVAESENGGLVFNSLGTVGFSLPGDAASFPPPPGYAKLVAASSLYGLTCFADHAGLCAIPTADLAEVTESLKEKLAHEQIVPADAFCRTPMRGVSHVSFSPDETVLAVCVGAVVHLFETRELRAIDAPVSPFRSQTLGDDDDADERIRDLVWLPEFPMSYLALVVAGEDGQDGKLLVGNAKNIEQIAPASIAERVRAFAVAPPDAAGSSVVAWAPADGGVVVAKLADGGYSAQMKPIPVGPIDDGEVEVVIDGVAFGPRPGLVLILATHAAEDAEAHQLLAVDAGASPVDSPTNPPACFELTGAFDIDDDVADLTGPFLHAAAIAQWGLALTSHRKAWDNQLCAVRCPGAGGEAPCVLDVEDDRCVPSIPLAGADEDSNYVVGLALDTTGCGGRMLDPADKSRPRLPQGPLALVATADARLTTMRVGHLDENKAMLYEAACVRPPLAEVPVSPAVEGSPGQTPPTSVPGSAEKKPREEEETKEETKEEKEEKEEKPKPAATGGFSAAFLAKANAGYSKAQEALEEELKSKAAPAAAASTAAASTAAVGGFGLSLGSAPATGGFSFGGGASSTASGGFNFGGATASASSAVTSGFGLAPASSSAASPFATASSSAASPFAAASSSAASPFAAASSSATSPFAAASSGGFNFGGAAASSAPAAAPSAPAFGLAPASSSTATGGFGFGGAAAAASSAAGTSAPATFAFSTASPAAASATAASSAPAAASVPAAAGFSFTPKAASSAAAAPFASAPATGGFTFALTSALSAASASTAASAPSTTSAFDFAPKATSGVAGFGSSAAAAAAPSASPKAPEPVAEPARRRSPRLPRRLLSRHPLRLRRLRPRSPRRLLRRPRRRLWWTPPRTIR